jgi:pteridine reductase
MKTALVTGAGRGIGRAIALALADAGYDVLVHAFHSKSDALATARDISARGSSARICIEDLSTRAGVEALLTEARDATDSLDALVCSAALFEKQALADLTRDGFARMAALNVAAPLFLAQGLVPALQKASGVVVNLLDSFERVPPGFAAYAATKAALESVTRALAIELAPDVRVVGVRPGLIDIPGWVSDDARVRMLSRVPQGRLGTADEVARAVTWLCSEASYVTGHVLDVDGGRRVAP